MSYPLKWEKSAGSLVLAFLVEGRTSASISVGEIDDELWQGTMELFNTNNSSIFIVTDQV